MLKEKSKKYTCKKKCSCGRSIRLARTPEGTIPRLLQPFCNTCRTIGLEESKKQYIALSQAVKIKKCKVQRIK